MTAAPGSRWRLLHRQRRRAVERRPRFLVLACFAATVFAAARPWALVAAPALVTAPTPAGLKAPGPADLLVFGAGYLGSRVAKRWRETQPAARVVAVTRGDARHADLHALGVEPWTLEEFDEAGAADFPYVVFAVPPSQASSTETPHGSTRPQYSKLLGSALNRWRRARGDRAGFVFTSSGGVFAEDAGGEVVELSQVSDSSPSAATLLEAERAVRRLDGTVLRLAGLYDMFRGPHDYWLNAGIVRGDPAGLLNFVHYDDAAAAVVSALDRGSREGGELFLVGDGEPTARSEVIHAALATPDYAAFELPVFTNDGGAGMGVSGSSASSGKGKVYNASRARDMLGWIPTHASFKKFMASRR